MEKKAVLFIIIAIISSPLAIAYPAGQESDPIAMKLEEAKESYRKGNIAAQTPILKAFDNADTKARNAADIDLVKAIKGELEEFKRTGIPPAKRLPGPSSDYKRNTDKLRTDLLKAYKLAIGDYLKAKDDLAAQKIKEEMDAFVRQDSPEDRRKLEVAAKAGFGDAKFDGGFETIRNVKVRVGDPQFTLIWDAEADLDLHVIEPGGKEIYWLQKKGIKKGELDVDNKDGSGPENIAWRIEKRGSPPSGDYQWYVHYYEQANLVRSPSVNWKVRVKHAGKVEVFEGVLKDQDSKSPVFRLQVDKQKK